MDIEAIKQNILDTTTRYLEASDHWLFHRFAYQGLHQQIEFIYSAVISAIIQRYPLLQVFPEGIAYLDENRTTIKPANLSRPIPELVDAVRLILEHDSLMQELLVPIGENLDHPSILLKLQFEQYQARTLDKILQAMPRSSER